MITLIIGTNANSTCSEAIATVYREYLEERGLEFQVFNLNEMPQDMITDDMYFNRNPAFNELQEKYLFPADQFIIIIPEYNGGVPGIFKLMLDVSDIKKAWSGKKACITGFATGRAGNLRGLDNLTNILNYLKVEVHFNKIPISGIKQLLDEDRRLTHTETIYTIHQQLAQFLPINTLEKIC